MPLSVLFATTDAYNDIEERISSTILINKNMKENISLKNKDLIVENIYFFPPTLPIINCNKSSKFDIEI